MELVAAHQQLNRALAVMLDTVRRLDEAGAPLANAAPDMSTWLTFDLGVSRRTARTWVRLAHRLAALPQTAAAFDAGTLSYDAALVVSRYATPDNEALLLDLAATVAYDDLKQVIEERLALATEPLPPPLACEANELIMWRGEDDRWLEIKGRFFGADGAHLEAFLAHRAAVAPDHPVSGLGRGFPQGQADALIELVSQASADDERHGKATLVVHVSTADLEAKRGATIGGLHITHDELLALACDSRVQPAFDDPTGLTVGVGRTTRSVPHWLRNLLNHRDKGCRFPGCGRTRWLNAHHLLEWTADQGPTNLDNLVLLCGFHHRFLHTNHWTIVGNPNHDLVFLDKWGYPRQEPKRLTFPGNLKYVQRAIENRYQEYLARFATPAPSPP